MMWDSLAVQVKDEFKQEETGFNIWEIQHGFQEFDQSEFIVNEVLNVGAVVVGDPETLIAPPFFDENGELVVYLPVLRLKKEILFNFDSIDVQDDLLERNGVPLEIGISKEFIVTGSKIVMEVLLAFNLCEVTGKEQKFVCEP